MRAIYFLFSMLVLESTAVSQETKQPLFALLSNIKNNSEYSLNKNLVQQELEIATMSDEPKGNKEKEKKRFQNFKDNETCIDAYTGVKNTVDKLITQLKADLTISNKKKLIKSLNEGTDQTNSWYKSSIDDIQNKYTTFYNCVKKKSLAASVSDITGIFSALVSVVTSAKDFRAQQIKALCEQLDKLRLKDFSELSSGSSSTSTKDETKEKE